MKNQCISSLVCGIVAFVLSLLFSGSSVADVHNLGTPGLLSGDQNAVFNFTDSGLVVDSVTISFDYAEPVSDASWASDVQVILADGTGNSLTIGGFTNVGNADVLWGFDGGGSDGPGSYGDSFATLFPTDGNWTLTLVNDWVTDPNPNQYSNLIVTMTAVPGPGIINVPGDFATIQQAIDAAVSGDEIVVAPGTYPEVINYLGKAVNLHSASGNPADTIIDGAGLNQSVVRCINGEGPGTILEGFTITGGNVVNGGGMFNNASSPTVTNCIFSGNISSSASFGGGGMYNLNNSNPAVTNCTFTGNTAVNGGAGMLNISSNPVVTNCIFSGNTTNFGGGMFNEDSNPAVTNCTFSGNTANMNGGGIYNVFISNPAVTNCTFSGNSAGNGGGMYSISNSTNTTTVANCIFWGNSPNEIMRNDSGSVTVFFSDLQGGLLGGVTDGGGNIDTNPVFVDADGVDNIIGTLDDDLRLVGGSRCIDAGDNTAPGLGGITSDLDGLPRLFDDAGMVDIGNGTPPIVDMGAYERQTNTIPGNLTFDPPSVFSAAGAPNIVAVGNLDTAGGLPEQPMGSTTTDVVVVIPDVDPLVNGSLQVFLNQGVDVNGNWLGLVANVEIPVGRDPTGVAVGDFDGDSFHDVAVTNRGDGNVLIFINDGSGLGTFNPPFAVALNAGDLPQAIAAGEFTGDGLTDLVVANAVEAGAGNVVILENSPPPGTPGTFNVGQLIIVGSDPRDVDPKDVDGDKDIDLLVTNFGSNTLSVLNNDLVAGYTVQSTLGVGPGPVDSAVGDLGGNGFPDFVTANSDGTVSVIVNQGGSVFDPAFIVGVGVNPQAVDVGDFDGDTDLDLIVVAEDPGLGPSVQALENVPVFGGGFGFVFPIAFTVDANPNFVVTADLDGNGTFDVITVNEDTGPTGGSVSALLGSLLCLGDVTPGGGGNGVVNIDDLVALLNNFGPCPGPPLSCNFDVAPAGGNGVVNIDDLAAVLNAFGGCP